MGSRFKLNNTYNLEEFLTDHYFQDLEDEVRSFQGLPPRRRNYGRLKSGEKVKINHTWFTNKGDKSVVDFMLPTTPKDKIMLTTLMLKDDGRIEVREETNSLSGKRYNNYDGVEIKKKSSLAFNPKSGNLTTSTSVYSSYDCKFTQYSRDDVEENQKYHYNRNGKFLFAESTKENIVTVWDGKPIIPQEGSFKKLKSFEIDNELEIVYSMLSLDGTKYVCCGYNTSEGVVKVYNVIDGSVLRTFTEFQGGTHFYSVDISSDGKRVVIVYDVEPDENEYDDDDDDLPDPIPYIEILDIETGTHLIKKQEYVHNAMFNPNGKEIATIGYNAIKILDAETGDLLSELKLDFTPINIAFNDEGNKLTVGSNTTVKTYRLLTQPASITLFHTPPDTPLSFDIKDKEGIDPIMGEEVSIKKHLDEDKDNVVFVFLDVDPNKTPQIVAIDKNIMKRGIYDKEYIVYECLEEDTMRNVDRETEYVNTQKLTSGGDLIYLDTLENIYRKVESAVDIYSRIFVFQRAKHLISTVSHNVLHQGASEGVLGARHCQKGQDAFVYTLHENVNFTQSGGKKRTRKNKKQRTRRQKQQTKKTRKGRKGKKNNKRVISK